MAEATAKQLTFMMDLHRRSEESYREWMMSDKRKRLIKQTREDGTLKTDIAGMDWHARFVFLPESDTLTVCREADWVERWPMAPPKYALTEDGRAQLRPPDEVDDEHNGA